MVSALLRRIGYVKMRLGHVKNVVKTLLRSYISCIHSSVYGGQARLRIEVHIDILQYIGFT
jgi:hypothetical protein